MDFHLNISTESIDQLPIYDPLCVTGDVSVRDVLRVMQEHRRGFVLVVENEQLQGIFTERDALKRMASGEGLDDLVSAAMTALLGEKEAYAWGVGKELADAAREGGSGFSFADLAADRAGIRFARGVLAGNPPLAGLAGSFRTENYVPDMQGLEEGLSLDEVIAKYGGQGDPRFDAQVAEIDRRIDGLPAYSLSRLGLP